MSEYCYDTDQLWKISTDVLISSSNKLMSTDFK